MLTREQLRENQFKLLHAMEETDNTMEKRRMMKQLEFYEALGDQLKGLPLTPEQKLLLFTKEKYWLMREKACDREIYEYLHVSRRTFYLWKKKNGLVGESPDKAVMAESLSHYLEVDLQTIRELPLREIENRYAAYIINETHNG
ncbi:hypothetical protein [Listeria costaricensis]|uniref:hypothetical protein n=1 Tax=Listeria costaricensis TaxID=2026604 RepID=UPI000C078E34|nr:hypothetical protein [Listeria costaricensis]